MTIDTEIIDMVSRLKRAHKDRILKLAKELYETEKLMRKIHKK